MSLFLIGSIHLTHWNVVISTRTSGQYPDNKVRIKYNLLKKLNCLFVSFRAADISHFLSLQNPAIADIYTEHAHTVTVAKYSPSGFYIASGGKRPTHGNQSTNVSVNWLFNKMYPIFFKFFCRCIWKDPYLGHHPERAHPQVRVHPSLWQGQGHCVDRGQQEDGCRWGRPREVSLRGGVSYRRNSI